jgi:glycosyltransferase involved in cell wall biosynthesis
MKELRVLCLVPSVRDVNPGQRYRIEQWEPHLRREGICLEYAPFLGPEEDALLRSPGKAPKKATQLLPALARRLRLASTVSGYDLAYVFRESAHIGPALVERILAARRIPYVFDFDDAVWIRYVSPTNSYFSFLRLPGKTATACRNARVVLAGNSFLASYAQRYNGRVTVVPTTIDTEAYRPLSPRTHGVPVVGWTGSHSTARYLQIIRPALEHLRERTAFRMIVVGAAGFAPRGVDVECRPWRSATEVQDLSDLDIGVMPLDDTDWERGKCALKALQYMALGLPPVVSPVGANLSVVEDGKTGLFARSLPEWERALGALIESPELRGRLGAAARARVESDYSAEVHAPRVAQAFREAVE